MSYHFFLTKYIKLSTHNLNHFYVNIPVGLNLFAIVIYTRMCAYIYNQY